MGKSSNPGNLLNPKNLIPAVLTGGISYGLSELGRNMKPPNIPNTPPPNTPPPPDAVHAFDTAAETTQERQKKLQQMQYGFASTITQKTGSTGGGSALIPSATPLKTKTGQ